MMRISIVLVAVAALAGCSKKKDEAGGGAAAGGGGGGAAAVVKLDTLGLELDVPGKVEVGKAIGGDGSMLQGSGIGAMTVEVAKTPMPIDEAKSDAKMYSPKNLKDETLPDGWLLTYENKGAMGTNYFVESRRTIDGKEIKCGTTGGDAKQVANVVAACKSLRKAG